MERQEGTSLASIFPGHKRRYEFATSKVNGRVLDAACGVGYGSKILQDSGCVVTGVDIEPSAIEKAWEYYPGPNYVLGSIEEKPWAGHFDWCVSFETVEHLPNPEIALKAFRESADKLICSTPNQLFYPFDPRKFLGDKYPHVRHYTPRQLDELLTSCGWEVLQRFCQKGKQDHVSPGTDGMFMVYVCR